VWPSGWHVEVVDETGSTNADLLAAAAAGAPDHSVLATRHQTAGRGRMDRRWDAPPGSNMLVSILFRDVPPLPHELTWRVGLAACTACAVVAGVQPVLKWPNDLLLDGRKLAGMLAQATPGIVVAGIGLNVGWAPPDAALLGDEFDPLDVLAALLGALDAQPDDIFPLYRQALATLGRDLRVELPGGENVHGRAIDVERDGRLVVLDQCGLTHRYDVADIIHIR
jgi:BirA family transcriptional regulator, biotin operon repressor / biotin---[acetyl-CoA-carboxylase] ligase